MRSVGLDFACNDPDSGLFAGRIEGIQLYDVDPVFELEPRRSPAPLLVRPADDVIRISGKQWRIVSSHDWVGNWCWNRYFFEVERAADLLIWLHRRRLFALTCGESTIYSAWRSDSDLGQARGMLVGVLTEVSA